MRETIILRASEKRKRKRLYGVQITFVTNFMINERIFLCKE